MFEPIAIVGQSCLLPGALTPDELTELVMEGRDVLSSAPPGYWGTDPARVMTDDPGDALNKTWSDRGGYVQGFDRVFSPEGFNLPAEEIKRYDPMVLWLLHTAREALRDAGLKGNGQKTGLIFGNLSYPSHSLIRFAESTWLDDQDQDFMGGRARELCGITRPDSRNRFMSGLPAHVVARALGLEGDAYALDAACASSLYAVKLACNQLQDGRADVMLAGGVNRADDLIIHVGFSVLQALSRSGQSRPFHRQADGLIPTEGAGLIALKRLKDARAAGDRIHGIIRGIGLANDGRGQGLLVPFEDAQVRAMRQAYEISGVRPEQVSLLECHATGTFVGDIIEIRSMSRVYEGLSDVPIGTVKSNMGHPITVSGIAGILKVTGAMSRRVRPRTLNAGEPLAEIGDSPFRLLQENEPWDCDGGPRIAAISNFGFGGNNAHLIIEEDKGPAAGHPPVEVRGRTNGADKDTVAIVGIGTEVADLSGKAAFVPALFSGESRIRENYNGIVGGFTETIELPLLGLNFPPADLEQTLPQQLLVLKSALEACAGFEMPERSVLYAGMGCDAEVSRGGLAWKLPQLLANWTGEDDLSAYDAWMEKTRSFINPFSKAPAVLGAMPNIVANRISSQLNIRGQAFAVSAEELSGIRALELAVRSLQNGESDLAVACAVDISCEIVQQTAAREQLPPEKHVPGDAAVTLVLKRLDDARRDGDRIYALIDEGSDTSATVFGDEGVRLEQRFGHSHAASGLLHVTAAALSCYHGRLPGDPALTDTKTARVTTRALGGPVGQVLLRADPQAGAPADLHAHDHPSLALPLNQKAGKLADAKKTYFVHPPVVKFTQPDGFNLPAAQEAAGRGEAFTTMETTPMSHSSGETSTMAPPPFLAPVTGPGSAEPEPAVADAPAAKPAPIAPVVAEEPVTAPPQPEITGEQPAAARPVAAFLSPEYSGSLGHTGDLIIRQSARIAERHKEYIKVNARVNSHFAGQKQRAMTTLLDVKQ